MKLSEALIRRADTQKRIAQLRSRLITSSLVQEGSTPPEDPLRLLAELDRAVAELNGLIKRINRTNAATVFDATRTLTDASRTLTDAIADRDTLMLERSVIVELAEAASMQSQRYSRSELKSVATVDVGALQDRADELARRHRELDTRIQQINWNTDLLD